MVKSIIKDLYLSIHVHLDPQLLARYGFDLDAKMARDFTI
jgi:hypothetical protein